jgi:uncharacterized repeat protein (TIGR03803 family)
MKGSKSLLTFGFALAVLTFSLAVCAPAQTFTTLASFDGVNDSSPFDSLIQSTNGNFYATAFGGAHREGTVFEVSPEGKVTNFYNFCSLTNCADGAYPLAPLILGADGNFYGTTEVGGANGNGTIFKLTFDGKLTTLYSFCSLSSCADGYGTAGLIQGRDGNFYGTLSNGGANLYGVFFELTSSGTFKILHNFCSLSDCADGRLPYAPPMQGSNGNFYGTTYYGGGSGGWGVIYEITPTGTYKVLHDSCSQFKCADGGRPNGLAQDGSGNVYGTTSQGGGGNCSSYYFCGTIFKITPTRQYVVLHTFDGDLPNAGLALANDGNLYGITWSGGAGGGGNIFSITPEGIFTSLYSFCSEVGCIQPRANGLFQGTNGVLYGTTQQGGQYKAGEAFSLSNNLSPLVETVPVAGKVGKRVIILGNGLTGSTSVTFNGVAAAFTVESDTYIKATVPTGATTGTVSVVTPSGTLNSNPQFVVTK